MSASGKLRILEGGLLSFYCPGCKEYHYFDKRWRFDGNFEAPTFDPSLRVGPYHRMPHGWDSDTAPREADGSFKLGPDGRILGAYEALCHSFVRAGQIQFLPDCTHEFAGKTVPMADEE